LTTRTDKADAIARLRAGDLDGFNELRAAAGFSQRLDLAGADLSGLDLRAARLAGCDLSFANLDGARAEALALGSCRLEGVRVSRIALDEPSPALALLELLWREPDAFNAARPAAVAFPGRVDLSGCDLQRADLTACVFFEPDLRGARLARCTFERATLQRGRLAGADFRAARISGARLESCELTAAAFDGADLAHTSFAKSALDDSTFTDAALHYVKLSGASARRCGFERAALVGVTAIDADLTGARFALARINASFTGSKLVDADFRGAVFSDTDAGGADLSGASFDGPGPALGLRTR
jgi:uncharacterized protein YjbI with pentapeptide repeats